MPRVPNLRVAIVGAGLMGRAHARAALRAGAKVVAVSDADLVVAKKVALALGTGALYGSLDEVITPDRIDAVHVCTPAGRHIQAATIALDRGLHVLCEKPIAETAEETQALFERAARKNVILCPSQQFPFQKGAVDAAAHLASIGKIRWITAEMCTAGAATLVDSLHDEVVLSILPHPLSLIYGFLGGAISDGTWSTVRAERGEMLVNGVVRDTGISIVLSTHGRPTSNSMRLIGERGAITLDLFHGFSITEGGRVSRARKFVRPFASSAKLFAAASRNSVSRGLARETEFPGLTELCRRFYLAADKRGPTPITATEALDIALVRDRVIENLMTPA